MSFLSTVVAAHPKLSHLLLRILPPFAVVLKLNLHRLPLHHGVVQTTSTELVLPNCLLTVFFLGVAHKRKFVLPFLRSFDFKFVDRSIFAEQVFEFRFEFLFICLLLLNAVTVTSRFVANKRFLLNLPLEADRSR
jgi:hypothetical protein